MRISPSFPNGGVAVCVYLFHSLPIFTSSRFFALPSIVDRAGEVSHNVSCQGLLGSLTVRREGTPHIRGVVRGEKLAKQSVQQTVARRRRGDDNEKAWSLRNDWEVGQ